MLERLLRLSFAPGDQAAYKVGKAVHTKILCKSGILAALGTVPFGQPA